MYKLSGQVKEDEIGTACRINEEERNVYRLLVGKPKGKRPLGRPKRKWMDNVKIGREEIG
jgi:hypothetical protein